MKELLAHRISRRKIVSLGLLTPVAATIAITIGCEEKKPEPIIEGFDFEFAGKLLALTNEERIKRQLPPLWEHSGLIEAAKDHAKEMAQNDYVGHESLDGSTHIDRIVRRGFYPNQLITENSIRGALGKSLTDRPFMYFEDFMNSKKGHRENMLNPKLKLVGVGCYVKNSTRWLVVDFVGVP